MFIKRILPLVVLATAVILAVRVIQPVHANGRLPHYLCQLEPESGTTAAREPEKINFPDGIVEVGYTDPPINYFVTLDAVSKRSAVEKLERLTQQEFNTSWCRKYKTKEIPLN